MVPDTAIQPDLFTFDTLRQGRMMQLDAAVDKINKIDGTETVLLSSQQYPQSHKFADAIRHEHKSPCPTTRWKDIIKLK